ncbi:homoserine kinase [Bellilinea sp.]|uniref:homoserine kinase n=1 Tax=Bellilinea sp. TaxID=2838785 RepID=UPI002ADDEB30|nr:homoserine kinase [Bellilinea sp.]
MNELVVTVPATSANLGPGFDCLGLALDLWNTTTFRIGGDGIQVCVKGEGAGQLPEDSGNLVVQAFTALYVRREATMPRDLQIECHNLIPLSSGLGSSTAAILTGLIAANFFLGQPLSKLDLLRMTIDIEGHADNAAAALFGGLVLVAADVHPPVVRPYPLPALNVVAVVPEVRLPTREARAALPEKIVRADAIFNLNRLALLIDALREGDRRLLLTAMDDRIHQPYRFPLIPGSHAAVLAARELGAAAALSGAGPSVIAFANDNAYAVANAIQAAFRNAGVNTRCYHFTPTMQAARWYG